MFCHRKLVKESFSGDLILVHKNFALLFAFSAILFCFKILGDNLQYSNFTSIIKPTLDITASPKHVVISKLIGLPPLTTPFVQIADIEIPVSVVTTTLRPMTIIPRPAKCPKRSVWLQY